MVAGLKFLSKKGFNPQNNSNRKRVWEAQQHSKQEKERLRQRQEQLNREQEEQELERVTRGEIGGSQAQLRFMYDAPPGMNPDKNSERMEDKGMDDGMVPVSATSVSSTHWITSLNSNQAMTLPPWLFVACLRHLYRKDQATLAATTTQREACLLLHQE